MAMNIERASVTIPGLLQERVQYDMHAVACYHRANPQTWVPTTWSELWDQVRTVAVALHRLGLRKGERLAIFAPTCRQWQVAEMAGLLNGAVIVGVDPHASPEHACYILRHCGARCIIGHHHEIAQRLPDDILATARFVVLLSKTAPVGTPPNWHTWNAISSGGVLADEQCPPDVGPDDPAMLLYTSGTTGHPKAIQYTHLQLMAACEAICRAFPQIGAEDSMLCWLPMAHLFQRMMNYVAIARGCTAYFLEDPREIMTAVGQVRPSVFVAVPRFYEKLHEGILEKLSRLPRWVRRAAEIALHAGTVRAEYQRAEQKTPWGVRLRYRIFDRLFLGRIRGVMGGNIKFMITGSAPTPPWLLEFFHGIGLLVLEAYGLSENTVPMAANRPSDYRFGSVGKPLPENEIRFAPDGEIEVRGPGVFRGYYRDHNQDIRFTRDGFYRTGDVGRPDADGFLYLTGRKADIIKTSTGRRISPAKIEAAYCQSPYLDQVVVFGNGRKHMVGLVAVSRPALERELAKDGINLDSSGDAIAGSPAVMDLVRGEIGTYGRKLAPHEQIGNFALLPQPLSISRGELTPTLKIRRDHIGRLYADLIERLYRQPRQRGQDQPRPVSTEKLAR